MKLCDVTARSFRPATTACCAAVRYPT